MGQRPYLKYGPGGQRTRHRPPSIIYLVAHVARSYVGPYDEPREFPSAGPRRGGAGTLAAAPSLRSITGARARRRLSSLLLLFYVTRARKGQRHESAAEDDTTRVRLCDNTHPSRSVSRWRSYYRCVDCTRLGAFRHRLRHVP